MNIGDVFLRIVADDQGFQKDVVKKGGAAGSKGGQAFSQSFGAKLKGMITPGNLLAGAGIGLAVAKVTDFLGDAVQAAREENAAIATMTQSIKANDDAWNGNIRRIEEVIDTRQDLAFSDDEQREGLQRLVAVTGDVNEALELQRTAMDLARLRGMSLRDAGDLLGKVYSGNVGILKRYGIQLAAGTSATEALARIQEMAAGQAETYAETELGNAERLQIAIDNRVEQIGHKLLPAFNDLTEFVLDDVVPAFDKLFRLVDGNFSPALDDVQQQLEDMAGIPVIGDLFGAEEAARDFAALRDEIATTAEELGVSTGEMEEDVVRLVENLGITAEEAFHRAEASARAFMGAQDWEDYTNAISGAGPEIDAAAEEMLDGIPAEMEEVKDSAADLAGKTPAAIAAALLDNQFDVDDAMEQIAKVAEEALHPMIERAQIIGFLSSDGLAAKLRSNNPAVVAAAEAVKAAAEARLAELEDSAYQFGVNASLALASGINAGVTDVSRSAANAARAVRDQIGVNSEPEGADSPLRGITRWGGNIVKTLADGMLAELGTGAAAGKALAGALAPGAATMAFGGATALPGAPSGIASGDTINVNVQGLVRARSTDEIGAGLKRLSDANLLTRHRRLD